MSANFKLFLIYVITVILHGISGGEGVTGLMFAGCAAGLSESVPHYSLFFGQL